MSAYKKRSTKRLEKAVAKLMSTPEMKSLHEQLMMARKLQNAFKLEKYSEERQV